MEWHQSSHLVKTEDLNHHGTLFAGRLADWYIEGSFVAAALEAGNPDQVVCMKIHGLRFNIPARKGDILKINSKVVDAGVTSITVYNRTLSTGTGKILVEGFVTFVSVDKEGNKMPHNIVLENLDEEERSLQARARCLR